MEKKYLTREEILNCDDLKTEEVFVPEWFKGTVVVKMMSGHERDAFEVSIVELKAGGRTFKLDDFRSKLAAATIIDSETKQLMFTPGDIEALSKKSSVALDRVSIAASRLNRISAQDVEQLSKN